MVHRLQSHDRVPRILVTPLFILVLTGRRCNWRNGADFRRAGEAEIGEGWEAEAEAGKERTAGEVEQVWETVRRYRKGEVKTKEGNIRVDTTSCMLNSKIMTFQFLFGFYFYSLSVTLTTSGGYIPSAPK